LKQKFQILRGEIETSYLDPLKKGMNLSKASGILACTGGFFNQVGKLFSVEFSIAFFKSAI
jgi:hypothetical protein